MPLSLCWQNMWGLGSSLIAARVIRHPLTDPPNSFIVMIIVIIITIITYSQTSSTLGKRSSRISHAKRIFKIFEIYLTQLLQLMQNVISRVDWLDCATRKCIHRFPNRCTVPPTRRILWYHYWYLQPGTKNLTILAHIIVEVSLK